MIGASCNCCHSPPVFLVSFGIIPGEEKDRLPDPDAVIEADGPARDRLQRRARMCCWDAILFYFPPVLYLHFHFPWVILFCIKGFPSFYKDEGKYLLLPVFSINSLISRTIHSL